MCGQVALIGISEIEGDIRTSPYTPRGACTACEAAGFRCIASSPLHSRERVEGVLAIFSAQANSLNEQDFRVVDLICRQVGLAIHNTRLYSDADLAQLETILALTRDLGVNLAGVEIILNMRSKMDRMQGEVNEFMAYVKQELARGLGDWEQRLGTALVRSSPTDLVRTDQRTPADDTEAPGGVAHRSRPRAADGSE